MSNFISKTIRSMPPSGIREFFDVASMMEDAISLGVGEPDFDTPWHVREAAISSLEKGLTSYSSNSGMLQLREAVADYLQERCHLTYDPKHQILITVGASEGIDLALRMIIDPGDEILVVEPSYVSYKPCISMCGGVPKEIVTKEENEFRLTAKELKDAITPRTKALILPYPNNPTGAIMEMDDLEAIAKVVERHNLMVLSDEIYAALTYGDEPHTAFSAIPGMQERTVLVNGFSKSHSMTGWRMGYATGPKEIIALMTKLHQFAIMSAPTMSQYAAIEAMKNGDDDIEYMKSQYDMRRRLIVDGLNSIGLKCFEPEGAFYVFPSVKCTGLTSMEFCERLIRSQRVAVVPGDAFGACGEGFVRISYCYSTKHIIEALERMEAFLKEL